MNTNSSTKLSADIRAKAEQIANSYKFTDAGTTHYEACIAMAIWMQQREDEGVREGFGTLKLNYIDRGIQEVKAELVRTDTKYFFQCYDIHGNKWDELIALNNLDLFTPTPAQSIGEPAQNNNQDIEKLGIDIMLREIEKIYGTEDEWRLEDTFPAAEIIAIKKALIEMYNLGKSASQPIPQKPSK